MYQQPWLILFIIYFNYLQKERIFTVATAAMQEVDNQLQSVKVKSAVLKTQLLDVLSRISVLEDAN